MTRTEYLAKLHKYLKKLPKQDYDEAMDYFTEYFDEAGPENEAQVIADLGNPKEAAHEILSNLLGKRMGEADRSASKNTQNILWIALLAILALPVALPLLIVILVLLLTLVIVIFVLLLTLATLSLASLVTGFALLWESLTQLTFDLPALAIGLGSSFLSIGLAILLAILTYHLAKASQFIMISFIQWLIKGGKKS